MALALLSATRALRFAGVARMLEFYELVAGLLVAAVVFAIVNSTMKRAAARQRKQARRDSERGLQFWNN